MMDRKKLFLPLILLALLLVPGAAQAEWTGETVFSVADATGAPLFSLAGHVSVGDEYVSQDNTL